jgi:hypothetical protein
MTDHNLTAAELAERALRIQMRNELGVWYEGNTLVGGVIPFRLASAPIWIYPEFRSEKKTCVI